MEQSAFEAVMTGVNTFVFIIALTAAVMLMSSVIDMVNYANENVIIGMNGNLAEVIGEVNTREYTGSQVLTYYRRITENKLEEYDFRVKLSGVATEKSISSYIQNESFNNYLNKVFTLQYKGEINNKHTYVFVEVKD